MNDLTLFNDLFDDLIGDNYTMPSFTYRKQFPKVDVKESKEAYTLKMDVPGKTDKDVDIELNNNVITISSVKKTEKEESSDENKNKKDGGEKWLLKERTWTQFSRSFSLPVDVESDKISAHVKDGILTVKMPRKLAPEPKKITVSSEN